MPEIQIIPPYEQAYLLNIALIKKADSLQDAVITIGGQAIQYWVAYYYAQYRGSLPDYHIIGSVDVDYAARRHDVIAIASALGVDPALNENGQPPSLARFALVDSTTRAVKEVNGRYFAEPESEGIRPNTVDVIDFPSGFHYDDFSGDKLYLNTERFCVEQDSPDQPESHELIRVINPLACLRSRFSNLQVLRRNPAIEVARIKAMMIPSVYFLIEKFEALPFRKAREYVMYLYWLAWDTAVIRKQIEYNIRLYAILEQLAAVFEAEPDDYDLPDMFWRRELPTRARALKEKYERLQAEAVRRGSQSITPQ